MLKRRPPSPPKEQPRGAVLGRRRGRGGLDVGELAPEERLAAFYDLECLREPSQFVLKGLADVIREAQKEARVKAFEEAAKKCREHSRVWEHTNAQAASGADCLEAEFRRLAKEASQG
jgi:hypothetical protein